MAENIDESAKLTNNDNEEKSPLLAAFLGFVFGAFGLLYVDIEKASWVIGGFFLFGFLTGGTGGLLSMLICPFIGWAWAVQHNEDLNKDSGG